MAAKLVVYAPPTVDVKGGQAFPGGPGLYASAAARVLGAEAVLVGDYGYCTQAALRVEARLGAKRRGAPRPGPGAVFLMDYRGEERFFTVAGLPHPIRCSHAVHPGIGLLSPVYGEAPAPSTLLGAPGGVDAQGYARAGLEALVDEPGIILHYSRGELDGPPKRPFLTVETDGPRPVTVYVRGEPACRVPVRGARLEDPTGAGDAFTAALLLLLARGLDPCGAVEEASRTVPEALETAREAMEPFDASTCHLDCSVKVVFFDLDGTLIDTMEDYADEAARIIEALGGPSYEEARRLYLETRGRPFDEQVALMGLRGAAASEAVRRFIEFKKRLISKVELDPVVARLLALLRSMGYRLVLSTNNECSVVSRLEWARRLLDAVYCPEGYAWRKGAQHLWRAMAEYRVVPCQVLFVGDGRHDVEVYRRLGVRTHATRGLWVPGEAEKLLSLLAPAAPRPSL